MAKLTTAKRKALPTRDFAGPGRSYPDENASHAKNAKARASEVEHEGKMSKSEEKKIDAKANRVIKKDGGHPAPNITAHTDGRANRWSDAKERAFKAERAARKR